MTKREMEALVHSPQRYRDIYRLVKYDKMTFYQVGKLIEADTDKGYLGPDQVRRIYQNAVRKIKGDRNVYRYK